MAQKKSKQRPEEPLGQCLTRPVPNGLRPSGFWLVPEKHKFSGTNQKPERRWPFGTGLVRHCPQGLFSPFFTFLRALFFPPFRLSFAPTICPWVSEDGSYFKCWRFNRRQQYRVKKIYRFCFVLLCIWGQFPSTSSCLEGLYLEGQFNGGFFALPVWGPDLYLEGLIHGGAYFRNFTVRYVVDSVYYTFICHTFQTSLNSWFCGNTSSTNSSSASLQNALHGIDTLGIVSREDNNIGWNAYLFILFLMFWNILVAARVANSSLTFHNTLRHNVRHVNISG